MKIGVIGDTHFGAAYNIGRTDADTQLNSRLIDFSNTFNKIIDTFVSKGVEILVLTGDIFETRHPSSAQLNAFSKCLKRAEALGLEIVIVVGNHDQQRHIDTTTVDIFNHLEMPNISVFPNIGMKTFKDEHGKEFHLVLMPYRDRRMVNAFTNAEAIAILKNEIAEVINGKVGTKILIGHLMLEKTSEAENPDSFSINELVLPFNTFQGFDAVLMGHVHKHEIMSRKSPVIIYTGSMEKVSFGEKDHVKATVILDTNNIENFEIIKTETRPLYEINFDYSGEEKLFKDAISDKINQDIDEFDKKTPIKDTIVRLVVRVKDSDLYYINHQKIREHILGKKVNNLIPMQITSMVFRQLRNSSITEDTDSKKAMITYIGSLSEPDNIKKKLQKYADQIIDDSKGK